MREQILSYAIKYRGEYPLIKKAIDRNESWHKAAYEGHYITILDDEYPKELFDLENPPYILFYEGNLSFLQGRKICVIGSRIVSPNASFSCEKLVESLMSSDIIISGLAKGIDGLAHEWAIKKNRKTIGILGCGISQIYPKENSELYEEMKKNHLILSEYPSDAAPLAHHFPARNRILAALAQKCYVVEARSKSGTMITANYAFNMQREVIAFPYRFNDEFGRGCNELIEQGAGVFLP